MNIYVIEMVGTEYLKIGIAKNTKQRLRHLQMGTPFELHLSEVIYIGDFDKAKEIEESLHAVFAAHRVRNEWFRRPPQLVHGTVTAILDAAAELADRRLGRRKIVPSSPDKNTHILDMLGLKRRETLAKEPFGVKTSERA